MNLKDLAKQPQLIKMSLDDEETIKEYGEPLDFWTWDRQPMDTFLKMATNVNKDANGLLELMKATVLDSEGQSVIQDGTALPGAIMMRVINKIIDNLGK
jgi:hypothetical protein